MTEYKADKWVILQIRTKDQGTHYKVLAGFYGGYLDSNPWRISSGIINVVETEHTYDIRNSSGSIYICNKGSEGFTSLTAEILEKAQTKVDVCHIEMNIFLKEFNNKDNTNE